MEILEEIEVKLAEEPLKVAENQLSFDFLSQQPLEKAESFDWVAEETLVIVLRAKGAISPDFLISGKSMLDWVKMASATCKQKVLDEPSEEDFLEVIKNAAEDYKFVAVLYSDTPLLKNSTFLNVMEFFSKNRMNVLRLPRGFVFRGEFLKNAKMLLSSTVEEFDKTDFMVIDSAAAASAAFKVLNDRILSYHKSQGVTFFGESTIFVDADVEIESGAIIYPNNILKGQTYIGKNVILESGNYIFDTIVCDSAVVIESYLESSKVEAEKTVGPFRKIIGQKV